LYQTIVSTPRMANASQAIGPSLLQLLRFRKVSERTGTWSS
jgi:hypothetical protein